ncbi:MAG: serine/threonine protein kinase [Oscillospiraceae bacterium]|nr:serine/threonine protein kinase [Oscillospiraceae bacterium]
MGETRTVNGKEYELLRLLGHGKGGYSYLALREGRPVVLKQIHHEPCAYYTFGNKIEAERRDYTRLKAAGIRIPEMLDIDAETERIVKEYIEGTSVFELVCDRKLTAPYLAQVRQMAEQAKAVGLNLDYFPTNFIVRDGLLYYVDYECNDYMDEWSLENWGLQYWSRTPAFEAYRKQREESEEQI